ncbi:STM3941 family protein [Enemella sp. A6]|uniref:STM3941 family protein n=1 Tax=Enemella sp. A6 TaxID=3440152 RepID=UPI003EBEFF38
MRELVAKPSAGRLAFLIGAIVVFTIGGFFMLFSDSWLNKLIGVVAILFFGVGGVFALIRMRKAGMTFTADEQGLRPGNGGFVPWENIGHIGVSMAGGTKSLGVEILNILPYLDSLTPEQRRDAIRFAKGARAVIPELGDVDAEALQANIDEPAESEREELEIMGWARTANQGFDLLFAAMTLNQPVEKWVEQLSAYRDEALRRRAH